MNAPFVGAYIAPFKQRESVAWRSTGVTEALLHLADAGLSERRDGGAAARPDGAPPEPPREADTNQHEP